VADENSRRLAPGYLDNAVRTVCATARRAPHEGCRSSSVKHTGFQYTPGDYWKDRSTGWRPRGSTACWLVKHLPGRPKHDPDDSRWLAACFERGAVTPCFVPPRSSK
jgi:hypothetical protein